MSLVCPNVVRCEVCQLTVNTVVSHKFKHFFRILVYFMLTCERRVLHSTRAYIHLLICACVVVGV